MEKIKREVKEVTGKALYDEFIRVKKMDDEEIARLQVKADKQNYEFRKRVLSLPDSEKSKVIFEKAHVDGLIQALYMVEYHTRSLDLLHVQGFLTPYQAFDLMMNIIKDEEEPSE